MKRIKTLQRRLQSQHALHEAVSAMRSLAAHHFRVARSAIPAARAYRHDIEHAISLIGLRQIPREKSRPGLLIVAADLGLCDGYSSRLVETAVKHHVASPVSSAYVVGRKAVPGLLRAGLPIVHQYRAPSNCDGLTKLLLEVAERTLSDYVSGTISELSVVSARFEGVGHFTPLVTKVLPMTPVEKVSRVRDTSYVSAGHLQAVATREYLFIILYELLLDALAAEHGTRLVATETAEEWLAQRIAETKSQLAAVRREEATQEILDISSGFMSVSARAMPI